MLYVSDIIKMNVSQGLKPVLLPGKKLVMLFTCPACGRVKMTKYTRPTNVRAKKSQCTCGYTHHTAAW